jgi:hypothetical protein
MRSAIGAEWIIAQFTDRSRATGIVGDLLETATRRGTFWFWLSVGGIVLSLIWRRTIAFVVAFYGGLFWRHVFLVLVEEHTRPNAFYAWDPRSPLSSVMWFGVVLSMATFYAAIRYGLRDKFAQLALGLWGLFTIVMLYQSIPVVTVLSIALALSILFASVRSAQRRRASLALGAALVFAFVASLLSLYLRAGLENLFYYSLSRSDLERTIVNVCFSLLVAWVATATSAQVHDRLLRRDRRGTEVSPT